MKLGSNLNGLTFPPSTNFDWPGLDGLDGWPRLECTVVKLRGGIFKSGFRVAGIVCWSNSEHSEHSQYVESKVILRFQFCNLALLLSCLFDLSQQSTAISIRSDMSWSLLQAYNPSN